MPGNSPHIVVIGAGAFGGWTAWHLSQRGARVTLIDAWGPGNSRSSSGGETRVMRSVYGSDRIYVDWVSRAFPMWRDYQLRWNVELYHPTGVLWMCAADDSYVRAALPITQEHNFVVEELAVSAAKEQYPPVNFSGVESVFFEREAGYLLARQACRVVCREFQKSGGEFHIGQIQAPILSAGELSSVQLANGTTISADQFVFACGPWLGSLFPDVIGSRIQPTRQEVFYFGTPTGETGLPIWIEFGERRYYGIPDADGRGFKVADDIRGEEFDPTTGDRTPSAAGIAKVRDFLSHRFPKLSDAPLLESRVCQYENSPDGHFLIDRHPRAENVWIVGGGSGHGFKLGPVVGEHVAGCVLGTTEPEPFFSLQRFAETDRSATQFDSR